MRAIVALLILLNLTGVKAQDWPWWRGRSANGIATVSSAPLSWSDRDGIVWKTKLSGQGTSSPIVAGNLVFLTSQIGSGQIDNRGAQFLGTLPAPISGENNNKVTFIIQALHITDGRILWEHRFEAEAPLPSVH